ncbi:MAG: hypothetical protein ACREVX_07615 [Clostridium sp.]|uniref:hypothetical protein n=1 Tax=Clostridium sp. TaxID=1506 RepID=UPI003D6C7DE4
MICNSCNNEFININGLKFCPYCGEKIEGKINLEDEQNANKKAQFTQDMPVITKKDINKYKRDKFLESFKKTFIKMKVIIPLIVLLGVIGGGMLLYTVLIVKPVSDVRIKEDLLGKVVTLPKGTSIKIDKDNIKKFTVQSRSTDKTKDSIKLEVTLENGVVEAKTIMSVVYLYEGKNQWKSSGKLVLDRLMTLKPVVGMDEKKFLIELKKLSISISDTPMVLGGADIKNIDISEKTPNLESGKEEILIDTTVDSGLLSSTGKIKCNLVFENEAWRIDTIERNGTDDFVLGISPTFSDEKVIEIIKDQGFSKTVSYARFFDGKGFLVNYKFTKSIKITGKKFDAQNGTLNVTSSRQNAAGEINSVLLNDYTFSISLKKLSFLSESKTTVNSGDINDVTAEKVISTIEDAEVQGSNLLFWWSNSHKITTKEAKTFKVDKMLSKEGSENIKYVYGNITYKDDKNTENTKAYFVALYFLVYDEGNGYNWKLDKVYGEDSPNYDIYSKEANIQ